MRPKNLLKKNSVTLVEDRKEVVKVVGTLFGPLTRMWCRHEAGCLLKLAELGFAHAPRLISSTGTSFTMEKIEGKSLRGRGFIEEGTFLRVMDVVRQLHGFGFAHGNLRANNILIADGREPVLIDFETCCRSPNPLFFLARFADHVRLYLLWRSRVVQSNPDLVRRQFPGYVSLAMYVIIPINRIMGIIMSARKRLKRSLKGLAGRKAPPSGSRSPDAGPGADTPDSSERRVK